jgi:hypothetical protein
MRFMLLYKGDPPADATPSTELIEAMLRFHEELAKAGVLLAAEGLHPSGSAGWRVVYKAGKRTVVDGPFAESKELVAGFNLIEVKSKEEAIEWASRVPLEYAVEGDLLEAVIEVRQVAEAAELPEMTEEQRALDRRLRDRTRS